MDFDAGDRVTVFVTPDGVVRKEGTIKGQDRDTGLYLIEFIDDGLSNTFSTFKYRELWSSEYIRGKVQETW